jgi:CheY-like chemotaxis protein
MDGQEALDRIVEAGGADAFDIMLMDLHMPRKVGRAEGGGACQEAHGNVLDLSAGCWAACAAVRMLECGCRPCTALIL